jgi:hypothetical protein
MKRGSTHTPETKKKMRKAKVANWQDPVFRAKGLANLRVASHLGVQARKAIRASL